MEEIKELNNKVPNSKKYQSNNNKDSALNSSNNSILYAPKATAQEASS
jgi:hypothetical protein